MMKNKGIKITTHQIQQERFQYMLNTILGNCEKKHWERIGITTSSLSEYCQVKRVVENLKKRAKEKELNVCIEEIKPVQFFAESIETAKICDTIIFVERYMYSYYADMIKCVELLEKEEIPIWGVVTCR